MRLLYLGGIDLPMRQARVVQTLHTAHGLAEQGWRVTLAVGRAPRQGLEEVLADYGLRPHPRLRILALPTLRLPRLPIAAYVHPRLAVWNWSYGLAALLALRLLPADWRPDLVLARDPRLAWLFLAARRLTGAEVVYEIHELFSTRAREPVEAAGSRPTDGPAGGQEAGRPGVTAATAPDEAAESPADAGAGAAESPADALDEAVGAPTDAGAGAPADAGAGAVGDLAHAGAGAPAGAPEGGPPTRTPRLRRLEERVFGQALGLISLTEACRQLLIEEFGVAPERVVVAPDGVAQVPSELPLRDPTSRTVVYAGQLYPWKGVGTLVRALAELPGVRLKIVGGLAADDPHAAALRALAGETGVLDRIEFAGYLPHAAVGAAIAPCAAAVIPLPDNPMARYFTSPLKLFEYQAVGLPLVASDLPALREVLTDGQTALLVPPDDPPALAAALRRLLDDPALAERLRRQGRAEVAARTWLARAGVIRATLERWLAERRV